MEEAVVTIRDAERAVLAAALNVSNLATSDWREEGALLDFHTAVEVYRLALLAAPVHALTADDEDMTECGLSVRATALNPNEYVGVHAEDAAAFRRGGIDAVYALYDRVTCTKCNEAMEP